MLRAVTPVLKKSHGLLDWLSVSHCIFHQMENTEYKQNINRDNIRNISSI